MNSGDNACVHRDVAMQTEARVLLRPGAKSGTPAHGRPGVGVADHLHPIGGVATSAHSAGYAEGFELGRREGWCDGEARGLAVAEVRCEEALQQALEAHRREAERQAERLREAAGAERAAIGERLEHLLDDFQRVAAERLRLLEGDAVALAFEAVCRLIGGGFGQPDQLAAGIGQAMRAARGRPVLRVRVRPDGLTLLSASPNGRALTKAFSAVEWVADARIHGDGCILDNDLGSVDARMEIQLGQLRELWSGATHDPVEGLRPAIVP